MKTALRFGAALVVLVALVPAARNAAVRLRPAASGRRAGASDPGAREDPDRPGAGLDADANREDQFLEGLAGHPLDGAFVQRMWTSAMSVPSEPPATAASVNTWQLVGPIYATNTGGGRMTGRVRDIDAVNLRVLAASGGLWRFNFGAIAMSDSVPSTWFGSFATDPSDPNTILLGTGEYHKGAGTGLYKTTDGGAHWSLKPMSLNPTVFTRIRYAPDGSVVYATTGYGCYRSTDNGETWTQTLAGITTDLATVNGLPNWVYVTIKHQGVWRSTDYGVNWSQLRAGGGSTMAPEDGAVTAVRDGNTGQVWVYACEDTFVWRSTDAGVSWTSIKPPYKVGQSGYGPTISVCPDDPNTVLYGNVSCNRSTDGGAHWTKIITPQLHADYHVFAWDADGVGVWAGNDGGWSHSTDRGITWDSSANVMPVTQFYNVDCEKSEVGYMIGGSQDNNVFFTPNEALFWTDPTLGSTEGDAFGVCINLYDPTQMWAVSGESGGGIAFPRYRTIDGGQTWQEVDTGIDPNAYTGVIRTDNAYPVRLVTSAGPYVYESTDGTTWSKINTAFPFPIRNLTSSTRVSPNAVLYAALSSFTAGQRLYVRDGGSWYERSSELPSGEVLKVVPHPWAAYANEAWAIMEGPVSQKILYTEDRGVTWTDVTGDFPFAVPVTDLVPNPRVPGELYAGTMLGCYRSKNGGVNWERWTNGMPPAALVSEMSYIDLTPGPFYVVAATFGRSVWKRDVSGEDPMPTLTCGNRTLQEGDIGQSSAIFVVRLSSPQSQPVLVDYATADSTATVADNDYMSTIGTLYFAPGDTLRYISVPVTGDTQVEPDETFRVVLSNPIRADIANEGVGTIRDDDARRIVCQDLYVTNGTVNAIAASGGTLYIGGSFTRVGPATGSAVPIDAATGAPEWLPKVAGTVYAVAPDGSGGWYIGGSFTHVDGRPRRNLAHVFASHVLDPWDPEADDVVAALAVIGDKVYAGGRFTNVFDTTRDHLAAFYLAGGALAPWDPGADAAVLALAASGGTLYAGGDFTTIASRARDRIAALDPATGLATAWNPGADASVEALAADGDTVYAGGAFGNIGGQARSYLAALDATTGAATSWDPAPDNQVAALALDATRVYAGGFFSNIGGQARSGLAAFDRASGLVTAWNPSPDDVVLALAVDGATVYAGGNFANVGGQPRAHLAALDEASGLATSWDPDPDGAVSALAADGGTVFAAGSFSSLGASPRHDIAALDEATGMVTSWDPEANGTVLALAVDGGILYAGGSFGTIGGQPRSRIAALDPATGLATAWNPNAASTVRALLPAGTRIYVGGNFTTIGGQPRSGIACLYTSSGGATTWNPTANGPVYTLATDGTFLYAGGSFTSIGGQPRSALAALDPRTGAAASWNPNPDGTVVTMALDGTILYIGGSFIHVGGLVRPRLAVLSLSPVAVGSWRPNPDGNVDALAIAGPYQIYVGGGFTVIGGVERDHMALVRASTGQVSSWAPEPGGTVTALTTDGSTLYAGGSFGRMGGLPQAHVACLIPLSLVDVPPAGPIADISVRLAPNPTAGRVRVAYALPEAGRVRLDVYDLQGRRVGPSVDAMQSAGPHEETWNGTGGAAPVSPGVYFMRFEAGGRRMTRRFVIVR